MGKLRVVHISDLHLFVNPDGTRRSQYELSKIVAWGMRHQNLPLMSGFNIHEAKSLAALCAELSELCANKGMPVVIIQSGDVSTFGAKTAANGSISFPEWQFWNAERAKARPVQPTRWIDLYGNHDVWPGTLPVLGLTSVERARDELRQQHHPHQLPERHAIPVGPHLVEIYTVNTVQHTVVANSLAQGRITFDHRDRSAPECYPDGSSEPLIYITRLAQQHHPAAGARVLRMLVMHHPPRFFSAPGSSSGAFAQQAAGPLENAAELERWLAEQEMLGVPQHLVLAGHRHLVDPASGQSPIPLANTRAVQLVCGTPTQDRVPGDPVHSFSVYDIELGASMSVTRMLYERPVTARRFKSSGAPLRVL